MNYSKKYKKREGSSLVVVLMIFTVLFILSTTVMSTLATGIKLRDSEKNQVQNLYGAESGITLAQAAVEKTFIMATNWAQQKATTAESFEESLKEYVGIDSQNKYTDSIKDLVSQKSAIDITIVENSAKFVEKTEDNPAAWQFTVQSDFTQDKILRRVQADFKITIPEWDGKLAIEIPSSEVLTNNLFTIDGDLTLKGSSQTISGNIHVKGNEPKMIPTLEEQNNGIINLSNKYSGGINNQAKSVNIDGIVSTNRNLINSGGIKLSKNIYTQNIFIDNSSNLVVGDAIVNNDLIINATDQASTQIDNFYGINDKTVNTIDQQRSSSSIIVNQPTTQATTQITNSAYIAGTAFIDLAKPYQTGESIAVNGNYLVYTLPVSELQNVCSDKAITDEIGKCEQFIYQYLEPLQLITGTTVAPNKEWTVQQKATYFTAVAENASQIAQQLQHGNISLPTDTFAAGAIVKKKSDGSIEVLKPTTTDGLDIIKTKQQEYAQAVYRLGLNTSTDLQELYDQPRTDTDNRDIWTVAKDVVDFTKGTAVTATDLIYNPDPNKTIELTNTTCTSENICLQVTNTDPRLIITNGKVVINAPKAMSLTTT
ncbi:MAG: pilus assembly PilX N-terminal domain-containing protein, partial [Culicoidibacterales bacterium]